MYVNNSCITIPLVLECKVHLLNLEFTENLFEFFTFDYYTCLTFQLTQIQAVQKKANSGKENAF